MYDLGFLGSLIKKDMFHNVWVQFELQGLTE